jgi:hypothetical protein
MQPQHESLPASVDVIVGIAWHNPSISATLMPASSAAASL